MSRQDKATTDKFARTLRELVKQPENKVCADCKHNDPRWASWNIGVFLCIRCSGIHRGMGTHISKVKSIDLDTWTPEQMESIQKWGNYLANLYWEAHLRAGHVPPDHKMESFIRSKYESRRWALDGPPPIDPSVLAKSARVSPSVNEQPQQVQQPQQPPRQHQGGTQDPSASSVTARQPQAHQLLSTSYTTNQRQTSASAHTLNAPAQAEPPAKAPENDLFSLDFHAPPVSSNTTTAAPRKDVKQDILSLFSNSSPASIPAPGQFASATSPWTNQQPQPQPQVQQPQATSMIGTSGVGAWGASSGWGGPAQQTQNNLWGASPAANSNQQQQAFFNTTAVWGSSAVPPAAPSQDIFGSLGHAGTAQKKDDAFGDLWGGFK